MTKIKCFDKNCKSNYKNWCSEKEIIIIENDGKSVCQNKEIKKSKGK